MQPLEQVQSLIREVDEHLDQTFDRVDRAVEPVWRGQYEMGRTLISLSSGAVILSISVVQFLSGRVQHPKWLWLLPAAWILLCLTVLAGAVRFSWASVAQSTRARFEDMRSSLQADLAALPSTPDLSRRVDELMLAYLGRALVEPQRAVKIHNGLNVLMFWTFTLGLGGLVTFAIVNLPR